MRHHVKKIRGRGGKDAVRSLMRKLAVNFIERGQLETTNSRAKALKAVIDRLVSHAKKRTEAAKNTTLKTLGQSKTVDRLFDVIAPAVSERKGGFVRLVKVGPRLGDNAEMVRLQWVEPIEVTKQKKAKNAPSDDSNQTSPGKGN